MTSAPASRLGESLRSATAGGDAGQLVALARDFGIDGLSARRAAKNIDINASDYVRLCAAVGIDAMNGKPCKAEAVPEIDWRLVSALCLMAMIEGNLTIRAAAVKWKLSTASIVRIRDGQQVNVENFLGFCKAMGCKPGKFRKRVPMFHGEQSVKQVKQKSTQGEQVA